MPGPDAVDASLAVPVSDLRTLQHHNPDHWLAVTQGVGRAVAEEIGVPQQEPRK